MIFGMNYTLTHEALCHGGGEGIFAKWFSHPGHERSHEACGETGHGHHPEETAHDSGHHDDNTHDHQLKLLLTKKDPAAQQQITPDQVVIAVHSIQCGIPDVAPCLSCPVIYRTTSSLQAYVRAHILLL